jgi:hypothetical protein
MANTNPQGKRLIQATIGGVQRTVEKVTAASTKRHSAPISAVFGSVPLKETKIHDPLFTVPAVTLSFLVVKEDAFSRELQALIAKHRLNPDSAGPITIHSYAPDGSVLSTLTLFKAVAQELKFPEGDTSAHAEAMIEMVFEPSDISGPLESFTVNFAA